MPEGQSGYQEKLAAVRSLSQETSGEKDFKKEQSRNLRMANYLSWAIFAQKTLGLVQQLPRKTGAELIIELSSQIDSINRPDIAYSFIETIVQEKDLVNKALGLFRKKSGLKSTLESVDKWPHEELLTVGAEVFRSITSKKPKDEVVLLETTLGVGVLIRDDADYNLIYGGENSSGGFYSHRREAQVGFLRKKIQFPLIVTKGTIFPQAHEENHAMNRSIINLLSELPGYEANDEFIYKQRWGGKHNWRYPTEPFETIEQFAKYADGELTNYVEQEAKDELLADFTNLVTGDFSHLEEMEKQDGLYHYFDKMVAKLTGKKYLNKLDQKQIDDQIELTRNAYLARLKDAVNSVKQITELYDQESLWRRKALFGFVLAQVPFKKWSTILLPDFLAEVKFYQDTLERAGDKGDILVHGMNSIYHSRKKKSPEDLQKYERLSKKHLRVTSGRLKLEEFAKTNPTVPLFEEIKKLENKLREF